MADYQDEKFDGGEPQPFTASQRRLQEQNFRWNQGLYTGRSAASQAASRKPATNDTTAAGTIKVNLPKFSKGK